MPIRPSSTVILVREASDDSGFETLLLRRSEKLKFAPGCWVFPGGTIDDADLEQSAGDARMAAMHAAVRETREECAVELAAEELQWYSHWTTPPNQGRRYATWYTVARIGREQQVVVDGGEIESYHWLTPAEAIARQQEGELFMLPPTYVSLLEMGQHATLEQFWSFARDREPVHYNPIIVTPDKNLTFENATCLLYDGDAAYESGDLDVEGPQHRLLFRGAGYEYINTL